MVDLGFAAIAATAVLSCHIEADLRVGLFFCLLLSARIQEDSRKDAEIAK
jgi:hypothetical protein